MKRLLLLSLSLVLLTVIANAHPKERVVKGVVTDGANLNPLEGVEISTNSSKIISGSQTDGIFTIPVSLTDSLLVFRFDTYETREIRLTGDDVINVQLFKRGAIRTPTPLSAAVIAGTWRGLFTIKPGVDVPFQFRIDPAGPVYLLNGEESFPTGNFRIAGDSLFIPLPLFENELAFVYKDENLSGVLRKQDLRGNPTLVKAEKGLTYRFSATTATPAKNISGTYDVVFQSGQGRQEKAVGIFQQQGNKVTATFLRITGDSRYLEGDIENDVIQLSSFIGSGPSYYKATVNADGTITGENIGARGSSPFTATLNPKAALPDAYTLTTLKNEADKFSFSFPDETGKIISATDAKFANKPLIITIGGTWCPNCMDEASFLGPWYEKNKQRGIEVIALQYERQTDGAFVKKAFDRFRNRYSLTYTMLLGGVADKQAVVASLPALNNFLSFPTTIFIDRTGKVTKIHTGFSGPATGEHYTSFIKEFNEAADQLLK